MKNAAQEAAEILNNAADLMGTPAAVTAWEFRSMAADLLKRYPPAAGTTHTGADGLERDSAGNFTMTE